MALKEDKQMPSSPDTSHLGEAAGNRGSASRSHARGTRSPGILLLQNCLWGFLGTQGLSLVVIPTWFTCTNYISSHLQPRILSSNP